MEGTNRTLCAPGPRGKEQRPHKRLTQTCLGVSSSLWWRCGSVVARGRAGGTVCGSACMDLLKEVAIIFITSTIVWPQANNREETQLHPSRENWIKDFLSMAWPIRTRPRIPHTVSSIRKLQEASYLYTSEGRQNENHNHKS